MDPAIYQKMREVEDNHWWFVARRRILNDKLKALRLSPKARILDAGCGTGGNLKMLSAFGEVIGMEMDSVAAHIARNRGIGTIYEGSFPHQIPFSGTKFDLITLSDVLEHIDDDISSLKTVCSLLSDVGHVVITVPAFQFLWSTHDELHHHKRRYRKASLIRTIRDAGLRLEYISYFNTWLFPLAVATRLAMQFIPAAKADDSVKMPLPVINKFLLAMFSSERLVLKHTQLPYGLSLLAIASKQ